MRHRGETPTWGLYGEAAEAGPREPLHSETIAARSRRHDGEIRPHRHERLFQIVVIRRGALGATLDGADGRHRGPCVVTVPAGAIHGFRFERDVDGHVLTVADAHLDRLLPPPACERLRRLRVVERPAGALGAACAAAAAVQAEFDGEDTWRLPALDAALSTLLLAVLRAGPAEDAAPAPSSRAQAHLLRLQRLIDERYRRQPTLGELAGELGLTTTQLNRVCRQALGRPALAVLHERLLREARRELAYSTREIKQIALDLGFCDAAYFSRFVRRHTGRTPRAWRAQAGGE